MCLGRPWRPPRAAIDVPTACGARIAQAQPGAAGRPRTKAAGADSDRAVRHRAAEHLAARDHEDAAGNRPAQLSSTSDCVSPTETPESVPETVFAPTRVNGPLSVVPEATPASTVGP